MKLAATADNFRAECARHKISHTDLAVAIDMNRQLLSMYLSGTRPIKNKWVLHNIGIGINRLVGRRVFDVEQELGLFPLDIEQGVAITIPSDYLNPLIFRPGRRKTSGPKQQRSRI